LTSNSPAELHNQTMTITTFEEDTFVMNKLLQKQINKHLDAEIRNPPAVQSLLQAVNDSYAALEQDKDILHHAFTISEQGYKEVNANLLNEFKLKRSSIDKLEDSLHHLNAD